MGSWMQTLTGAHAYVDHVQHKVIVRAAVTFGTVEVAAAVVGVGVIYQVTGGWPTPELWLATMGGATFVASVADHLAIIWTIKHIPRDVMRDLAGSVAGSVLSVVTTADVRKSLGAIMRKWLNRRN